MCNGTHVRKQFLMFSLTRMLPEKRTNSFTVTLLLSSNNNTTKF